MLKISQQQISDRWDTLPMSLRESLYSPEYGKLIWQIGANQHLDDKKIGIVAGLAGYVVFGFMHPEDLTGEIKTALGINPEIAASISREIDRKIFGPIKGDLDKIYSPPIEEEPAFAKATAGEEEIIDLRKTEAEKPIETGLPKIITEKIPSPATDKIESEIPYESVLMPKIIHEEKKIAPLADGRKRSLGGLFGFLRKKDGGERKEENAGPVKIQLETLESFGKSAAPEKPPIIAKTEITKPRIVHYSDLRTLISPFGATKEEREEGKKESKDIKPPENLPITEPPKIEPAVENEDDVIDLRTFEKIKKQ